jgi:hypothetical protein
MSRSVKELINDYDSDPSQWELIRTESVPSTNRYNIGGTSVQELFRHKGTGEELVRHTLLRPDGSLFDKPHFRGYWK